VADAATLGVSPDIVDLAATWVGCLSAQGPDIMDLAATLGGVSPVWVGCRRWGVTARRWSETETEAVAMRTSWLAVVVLAGVWAVHSGCAEGNDDQAGRDADLGVDGAAAGGADVGGDADADVDGDADVDVDGDADVDVDWDADANVGEDADVDVDWDADADVDGDADRDTETGADIAADRDGEVEPWPDADVDAEAESDVGIRGDGVFLYTGAGGGGPVTDMYIDDVRALFADAGHDVVVGETLPSPIPDDLGLIALMNPTEDLPDDVGAAGLELTGRGGRILVVMEHCKDGCWGNAETLNSFLATIGSTMSLSGEGGGPLERVSLSIASVPPITDGVESVVVYYTGSVDPGDGISLGVIPGGDVVIGWEAVGAGDVVTVADSTVFGYVLGDGDNERFVQNLAVFD
jgi:hypothetical protein